MLRLLLIFSQLIFEVLPMFLSFRVFVVFSQERQSLLMSLQQSWRIMRLIYCFSVHNHAPKDYLCPICLAIHGQKNEKTWI
ncbi:TPA: hypothetical protein DIC21_01000, partial [Candidatus Uhrbacteria bacterium]|nr:hypothetical protein [Candidatus Uhrbacteria bacterium]